MKTQINALTSTRGFAAIMVFIFHFGITIYPFNRFTSLFYGGNIAVSYFFVLSGFVLYYSYANRKISYFEFLKKRIARIAPVYYFALAFYLITLRTPVPEIHKETFYSVLFIQAYFPKYALCLNTAAWSICAEMLFYTIYPFLQSLMQRKIKLFMIMTVFIFIITQMCMFIFTNFNDNAGETYNYYMYNPFFHLNEFMIGMSGAFIFGKISGAQKKISLLPFVLLCAIILLVVMRQDKGLYYCVGLMAPVFMLFIVSVAMNNPKFLSAKPLVFLGEISYGIYILQFPVIGLLNSFDDDYKLFSKTGHFYFNFCILTLTATITYYFIEKPLRKKINALHFERKNKLSPTEVSR